MEKICWPKTTKYQGAGRNSFVRSIYVGRCIAGEGGWFDGATASAASSLRPGECTLETAPLGPLSLDLEIFSQFSKERFGDRGDREKRWCVVVDSLCRRPDPPWKNLLAEND